MVRQKAGLNRVLLDRAFGEFRRMLEYEAPWHGSRVVVATPAHTSQTCSRCGHVSAANRQTQAAFRCVRCGFEANADLNAAINILAVGTTVSACGAAA